jgi:carboxyl-terminal processing protease
VNEISELLKGQPQSKINITIQRNGEPDPIIKAITREEVKIDNVAWYGTVADQIGYIQFNGFTENAHHEVRDALIDLKKTHDIESVILDVRGNPGGLLMEAVNVTNLFVDKDQDIVSTRGKLKQWDHIYRARKNPLDPDIPVIVLVGKSSASAAEIVAGALQDLDRGVLIGQRTFGKGLIQTTRQLSYNAQLKITTAKYYTPSGRCIQSMNFSNDNGISYIPDSQINEFRTKGGRIVYDGGGIMPDIEIEEKRSAPVVVNLYARNHIFNYATLYAARNPVISPVSSFQISDEEYRDFLDFLEEVDFDYQTQTEANLKQLINSAKQEQYYDLSSDVFKELEEKIRHDKKHDLEKYKDDIIALLREEIASRYYYQKGRIEASLTGDPYIEKAIETLKNRAIYNSILGGSITNSSERQKINMTVSGQSIKKFHNLINC